MQNIVPVHVFNAQSNLIQTPLAKFFRQRTGLIKKDLSEAASLHEVKNDPQSVLEVININTIHQIISVQVRHQSAFVDHIFSFLLILCVGEFHGEFLLICLTLSHEDCTEATLTNFAFDFVNKRWVLCLDFA